MHVDETPVTMPREQRRIKNIRLMVQSCNLYGTNAVAGHDEETVHMEITHPYWQGTT